MRPTIHMTPVLAVKLGSLIVHLDEYRGEGGHPADRAAADSLLADPDVVAFLKQLEQASLLPYRILREPKE